MLSFSSSFLYTLACYLLKIIHHSLFELTPFQFGFTRCIITMIAFYFTRLHELSELISIFATEWSALHRLFWFIEEALCLSCSWKLGNFQISKEDIVVPHVYNVGCYFHICLLGFPRTFNYDVALQYHVPVLNTCTARLFIIGYIHK